MVLKKKTIDDPRAVTPQVNKVAKRASNTGLYSTKKSSFIVIYFYPRRSGRPCQVD
jgi:peroxiredoxin